jgi:DNA-directed RNA polymerase subunit RPC12/RpoP
MLDISQYLCSTCNRTFFIVKEERNVDVDFDFGCPYGCDDNGIHICDCQII